MRYLLLLVVLTFPVADIYATLRLSAWSHVPPWVAFSLGLIAGCFMLAGQRMSLRAQTFAMISGHQPVLPGLVDSGRKMLAGVLFILPGVISDCLALVLLFMPINLSRRPIRSAAHRGPRVFDGHYRRTE
jgi:UPF0716 protein FxsA